MIKKRGLPLGWYPQGADEVRLICDEWNQLCDGPREGIAAIVPHAGWYYSGATAFKGIHSMIENLDVLVVAGGHLSSQAPIHLGHFEAVETPLGDVNIHRELFNVIAQTFPTVPDSVADNSVEIQLPLIKYLYPNAKILWVRLPPNELALQFGHKLGQEARTRGIAIGFVGSTDLTHYGDNYGFSPVQEVEKGLTWMRDVNDKKVISSLISMDGKGSITLAMDDNSACSIGAAAGAVTFAKQLGIKEGHLVEYLTSYDRTPSSSFVGYAAISF